MEPNAIIGIILLIVSVTTMTVLVFLSKKRIDRIARKKSASVREIMREIKNGE